MEKEMYDPDDYGQPEKLPGCTTLGCLVLIALFFYLLEKAKKIWTTIRKKQ